MCHRRGRRAPALVVLGKMAYDKYQERNSRKLQENNRRSPSPEFFEREANREILAKAGIAPPSYNDVVVNRAMIPESHVYVSEIPLKDESYVYAAPPYAESLHSVANGMQYSKVEQHAQPTFVGNGSKYLVGRDEGCRSKCERKRAAKLARKAEKNATKVAATEMRMRM